MNGVYLMMKAVSKVSGLGSNELGVTELDVTELSVSGSAIILSI